MAVYYLAYFMLLIAIGLFTRQAHVVRYDTHEEHPGDRAGCRRRGAGHRHDDPAVAPHDHATACACSEKYFTQLLNVLNQPVELAVSICGGLVQNITTGLAFWSALLAFGVHIDPVETIFVFMLAYALGSAVPTPGGLGGVEAALTFAFVAVGVPQGVALSATLLHRVVFYWLRIPLGALAMQ